MSYTPAYPPSGWHAQSHLNQQFQYYPPQAMAPPKSYRKPSCCQLTGYQICAIVTACVIVAGVAATTAIILTGALKSNQEKKLRQVSYDPLYYGNLHPYLPANDLDALNIDVDWDVVIIGAGVAGLAAAETLQKSGLSVLVLEAQV